MERRSTYYSWLIGVLMLVVFLCMRLFPMNKLHYYIGERLFPIFSLKVLLFVLLLAFNRKILKYITAWNILLSLMLTALAFYLSFFSFHVLMDLLETLDNKVTPLGWQFKYLWAENILFGFLMVVLTELVYVMVKSDRLLKME